MPLTEADADKAYALACDSIQNRIKRRVGPKSVVFFSAYALDADRIPIDNLDDVPVTGKLRVRGTRSQRIQRSESYESSILENPSWLDLCVFANEQIIATRDREHRFLENIEVIEIVDGIKIVKLCLGV
jgi:hypothetical protein